MITATIKQAFLEKLQREGYLPKGSLSGEAKEVLIDNDDIRENL